MLAPEHCRGIQILHASDREIGRGQRDGERDAEQRGDQLEIDRQRDPVFSNGALLSSASGTAIQKPTQASMAACARMIVLRSRAVAPIAFNVANSPRCSIVLAKTV